MQDAGLRTIAFIDAGQFRPSVVYSRLVVPDGSRFDWDLFKRFLEEIAGSPLHDANYFDSTDPNSDPTRQANFHLFLRNQLSFQLHFSTIKEKHRRCASCGNVNEEYEQKGVDVSMTVSMLKLAYANAYDQALLCSGDGDFAPLVGFLRESLGKRVIVVGWSNGVAPALRDAAYTTVILNDHTGKFIGDKNGR